MTTCQDPGIVSFISIIKTIFTMIEIIAPVVLMVSLGYLFLRNITTNDAKDFKKNQYRILNAIRASVIVFFLPVAINLVMIIIGENFEIGACWKEAKSTIFSTKSTQYYKNKSSNKKTTSFIIDPSKYKNNYSGNPNEKYSSLSGSSYSSGDYKGKLFSPETLKIVNAHKNDFNYYNFKSFMSAHGGAGNYIKSLGGVFEKYYGKKVKVQNKEQFHEVSEYVFGLMTIWGFDYNNNRKYCKWGGSCGSVSKAADDAFYPAGFAYRGHGLSDKNNFDNLITGKKELNMTTNCNWTVDMVYIKAGLGSVGTKYKNACKTNYTAAEAQVGDTIHFFKSNIDKSNPSTWHNWYHVAYIGEVYPDKIVGYDGGSYFTNNRNYKWEAKKNATKIHGNKNNWLICRPVKIPG